MHGQGHDSLTFGGLPVALVEFDGSGRPYEVFVAAGSNFRHHDVQWCGRDGRYYHHQSGGGAGVYLQGSGEHWASPGLAVPVRAGEGVTPRPVPLPEGLQAVLDSACAGEVVYCSRCDDWLPEEEPCGHVWWCDRCGCFSTPDRRAKGEPARCKHNRLQAGG